MVLAESKKILLSIVETLVVNFIIYFLYYTTNSNQEEYLFLNPHPLLVLSLLMGMRYGNYLGIISALISSLFYARVFVLVNGDIILLFAYFSNYKYILLFFWSAMIFGLFKDNFETAIENLTMDNKLLLEKYKQLKKINDSTQKTHEELKKQIIGSEESILNLYEIASRLETLDEEEVYTETIGILSKYLKADAVSIYTNNDASGYLRLKIRIGEHLLDKRSLLIRDSVGFSKVVMDKVAVRWTDVREEHFPLMSAPLIKDDKVLAVVNIEHMDFDKLSEYAYQLFMLIIQWVNKALGQAIYVDELKGSKYIEDTRLLRYDAYIERLKAEERRHNQFGLPYCSLRYRVNKLDAPAINGRIGNLLRTVDVVSYDINNKILYVLLPATSGEQIPVIEARLHDRFGEELGKVAS